MTTLSRREQFALAAMQGICAHVDTWGLPDRESIAKKSYEIADSMLAESARTAQPETAVEPDGWIPWSGGDCPVAADIVVEVHLADDVFSTDKAIVFDWTHDCDDRNIIAYRVVQS